MTNLVKNMQTHEADGDEDVQEAVRHIRHPLSIPGMLMDHGFVASATKGENR